MMKREKMMHLHADIIFNILLRLPVETIYRFSCVCRLWHATIIPQFRIMVHILLRLPVKTLYRFSCVCRLWHATISDPQFRSMYHDLRLTSRKPLYLFSTFLSERDEDGLYAIRLTLADQEFRVQNTFTRTVTSTRVYLLFNRTFELVCFGNYVCNPSTEEFIALPDPPRPLAGAFFGFGYSSTTNEYKVIRLVDDDDSLECQVFTLGGGGRESSSISSISSASSSSSWRRILEHYPYGIRSLGKAFVNGSVHWIAHRSFDPHGLVILAFDVDMEEFREIPTPKECFRGDVQLGLDLVELRGCLCLKKPIAIPGRGLDIWMLKDYYKNSWVKEYAISLAGHDVHAPMVMVPRDIRSDGAILMQHLHYPHMKFEFYHPQSGNFTEVNFTEVDGKAATMESRDFSYFVDRFYSLGGGGR